MTRTAPTQSAVRRHPDLEIPVFGETVAATRYEPVDASSPQPALLMYIPYHKDDWISYGAYDPSLTYLASRGYEVVVADMVGTGASTGHIDEMFEAREGREAAAIVDWLADQPWTNGRIGMFGKSYGGFTSLFGAAEAPDALDAIVPIQTPFEGYRNAFTYGGAFELATIGMHWLTLMQVLDVKPPSRRVGNWAEVWQERLESARTREPWLLQFLAHQAKDAYWADKDIPVEEISVPTLAIGGWRDPYVTDTRRFFRSLDGPKRLLMGPWRHTMPHRGHEVAIDFRKRMADWFDHYLRDESTGVTDWPEVTVWTEGSGVADAGRWEGIAELPSVDAPEGTSEIRTYTLSADGLTASAAPDDPGLEATYQVDPTVGVDSVIPYDFPIEDAPTNADDARSLCFDSEPLSESLQIVGHGEVTLTVETGMADPMVSARMVDVAPDGEGSLITHGTNRVRFRDGLSEPREVPTGEPVTLTVPLEARSYVLDAGHRLRLAIAGSFFPELLPTGEEGSFTIRSTPEQPAELRIPTRGAETPSTAPVEFGPPETSVPTAPGRVSDQRLDWTVSRDRSNGTATVTRHGSNRLDLPHATMTESGTYTATVSETDPGSFRSDNDLEFRLEYDSSTVEISAANRITHDIVAMSTEVQLDDLTIFDQTWTGSPQS